MTDKELLELAARAAGYSFLTEGGSKDAYIAWNGQEPIAWNPLTNDGDALRLTVRLEITIGFEIGIVEVRHDGYVYALERIEDCRYAATRRAIVRAAAEIGKELK